MRWVWRCLGMASGSFLVAGRERMWVRRRCGCDGGQSFAALRLPGICHALDRWDSRSRSVWPAGIQTGPAGLRVWSPEVVATSRRWRLADDDAQAPGVDRGGGRTCCGGGEGGQPRPEDQARSRHPRLARRRRRAREASWREPTRGGAAPAKGCRPALLSDDCWVASTVVTTSVGCRLRWVGPLWLPRDTGVSPRPTRAALGTCRGPSRRVVSCRLVSRGFARHGLGSVAGLVVAVVGAE